MRIETKDLPENFLARHRGAIESFAHRSAAPFPVELREFGKARAGLRSAAMRKTEQVFLKATLWRHSGREDWLVVEPASTEDREAIEAYEARLEAEGVAL